jgi:SulP family sulfate permease
VFLLALVVGFGGVVARIPMAALVAVMTYVSIITFEWHSIMPSTLRRMPKGETVIMLVTVAATVITHNLAIGVGLGVLAAMVVFARRAARMVDVVRTVGANGATATYTVTGELFFASEQALEAAFAFALDPPCVVVDLSAAHVWDASAVAALDSVEQRYHARGIRLEVVGLNVASHALRTRLAT